MPKNKSSRKKKRVQLNKTIPTKIVVSPRYGAKLQHSGELLSEVEGVNTFRVDYLKIIGDTTLEDVVNELRTEVDKYVDSRVEFYKGQVTKSDFNVVEKTVNTSASLNTNTKRLIGKKYNRFK